MKSVRLVQIFCPAKANRTHSKGYVEDLSTQAGQKRCAKNGAEFISASVALLSHIYDISAACLAQTVHDGKPETDRTRALGEE